MSAFLIRADRADLRPLKMRATVWIGADGARQLNSFRGLRAFTTRAAAEALLPAVRLQSPYATCDVVEFVKKTTPEGEKTDAVVAQLHAGCSLEQIEAAEKCVATHFKTSTRALIRECWDKDEDTRLALSACIAAIYAGAKNGRMPETLEEVTAQSLDIASRHMGRDELLARLRERQVRLA